MDYEYLVDGKLFEFFELFLPYLSRYLSPSLIDGADDAKMETKIALRLKDVFEYTCSLCSAREVYTYTMANIEIYRKLCDSSNVAADHTSIIDAFRFL